VTDDVIYVEVGYHSEEDAFQVGDQMAEVGAQIVEELDILIALVPFVIEQADAVDASQSTSHYALAKRSALNDSWRRRAVVAPFPLIARVPN
jgi:hypothetical protein